MQQMLESARTWMRPFTLADATEAFAWFSDSEVMRHIPFGPDGTVDETCARIARYLEHQNLHGFSKWVIVERESQKLIGDGGFYFLPDGERVELGYRLSRDYWGQGFATEVGKKWVESASQFISVPTVFAFAHPQNTASLHVLHKLGFKFMQDETFYGWKVPLHALQLR